MPPEHAETLREHEAVQTIEHDGEVHALKRRVLQPPTGRGGAEDGRAKLLFVAD